MTLVNENTQIKGQGLKLSDPKLYGQIHDFLRRKFIKKGVCEHCKERGRKRYEVALIQGRNYSFNLNDYIELCVPCHRKYDFTDQMRLNYQKAQSGRTPWNKGLNGAETRTNKPVAKINPVDNSIVKIYNSILEASKEMNCSQSGIVEASSGKRKNGICFGFKWHKILDIPLEFLSKSDVYKEYISKNKK